MSDPEISSIDMEGGKVDGKRTISLQYNINDDGVSWFAAGYKMWKKAQIGFFVRLWNFRQIANERCNVLK